MEAVVKLLLIFGGMFLLAALAARLETLVGRMMIAEKTRKLRLLEIPHGSCVPLGGSRVKFWVLAESGRPVMVVLHAADRSDLPELYDRFFPASEPSELADTSEAQPIPVAYLTSGGLGG